jgi:hypothetical protein
MLYEVLPLPSSKQGGAKASALPIGAWLGACSYLREGSGRISYYPSDLTDEEWALLEPLIPAPKPGGRPAKVPRREIVDAIQKVFP